MNSIQQKNILQRFEAFSNGKKIYGGFLTPECQNDLEVASALLDIIMRSHHPLITELREIAPQDIYSFTITFISRKEAKLEMETYDFKKAVTVVPIKVLKDRFGTI